MQILYHQPTATRISSYPRNDNQPIEGLSSDYLVLNQVETTPPTITANQQLTSSYVVDIDALEDRQVWQVIDIPPVPNWDGLYQGLMVSTVYPQLVALGQQYSGIDGALDKSIDAIQYGIFKPDSIAALPAFQSAINLLLAVLTGAGQGLSAEQLAEVRMILDANNFQEITL